LVELATAEPPLPGLDRECAAALEAARIVCPGAPGLIVDLPLALARAQHARGEATALATASTICTATAKLEAETAVVMLAQAMRGSPAPLAEVWALTLIQRVQAATNPEVRCGLLLHVVRALFEQPPP
jgi:hypothetical protein